MRVSDINGEHAVMRYRQPYGAVATWPYSWRRIALAISSEKKASISEIRRRGVNSGINVIRRNV